MLFSRQRFFDGQNTSRMVELLAFRQHVSCGRVLHGLRLVMKACPGICSTIPYDGSATELGTEEASLDAKLKVGARRELVLRPTQASHARARWSELPQHARRPPTQLTSKQRDTQEAWMAGCKCSTFLPTTPRKHEVTPSPFLGKDAALWDAGMKIVPPAASIGGRQRQRQVTHVKMPRSENPLSD